MEHQKNPNYKNVNSSLMDKELLSGKKFVKLLEEDLERNVCGKVG